MKQTSEDTKLPIDHALTIQVINTEIHRLEKQAKPKLIGVYGQTRCGKTTLAKALSENDVNVKVIDVYSLKKATPFQEIDPSKLLEDPSTTYVIDEASYLPQALLDKEIRRHCMAGGCAVIFVQDRNHLKVRFNISWFLLSHGGLVAA